MRRSAVSLVWGGWPDHDHDVSRQSSFPDLKPTQRHYDALLNGLAAVVWEMDAETLRLTFTSRNIEAVFGHPYERWVQDRDFWVKRLHPEDRSRALEACTQAIALRRSFTLEYRMLRADGRAVWIWDVVSLGTPTPKGAISCAGSWWTSPTANTEEVLKLRIATLARISPNDVMKEPNAGIIGRTPFAAPRYLSAR